MSLLTAKSTVVRNEMKCISMFTEDKTIEDLPEELIKIVKELTHVMDLELSPERKLAREDVLLVIEKP